MKVLDNHYQSVWANFQTKEIFIINQTLLPFKFKIKSLRTIEEVVESIKMLEVRGAPAIGIAAAYAMWLSYYNNKQNKELIQKDYESLIKSRPTAVNLKKGADFVYNFILSEPENEHLVYLESLRYAENEILACKNIGLHGIKIIEDLYSKKGNRLNILTHCNAGWLACGDYGTALAPIFEAHRRSIPVHVWVDETRPLNQGSRLTAWELHHENISYNIIADNMAGLLMMQNKIDMVIVGADRIASNGDVANKIGTYLKALSAYEHNIPFYVAAPLSTFDKNINKGEEIVIEERQSDELKKIPVSVEGKYIIANIVPDDFSAKNYAFDITPAKFITAYITEKGIFSNIKDIVL